MLEYKYVIELHFPELNLTIDNPLIFTVVKTPIYKLSSFIYMLVNIPTDDYHNLINEFNKLRQQYDYLNCYLTIYMKRNFYSCYLDKTIKNVKEYVIVKNKILSIINIKSLTNPNVGHGFIKDALVQFILSNPTTLILKNQYSLSKSYYSTSTSTIINKLKSILHKYGVNVYDKLAYNNYIYDLIHIDQDISVLEAPYFLQKFYKVSNNIPCFFYDIFSSNVLFGKIDTYKLYSYDNYNNLNKMDLVNTNNVNLECVKDENFNLEKFSKFNIDPSTIVFVKNDGDTIIHNVNDKVLINNENDINGKYNIAMKESVNNFVLNLYAPDTPNNSLKRYYITKEFLSLIYKISRVEISDTDFRLFDIGVLYKHRKESKYNMLFHNLSYQFVRDKLDDNTMRCDVIGDVFLLNV